MDGRDPEWSLRQFPRDLKMITRYTKPPAMRAVPAKKASRLRLVSPLGDTREKALPSSIRTVPTTTRAATVRI